MKHFIFILFVVSINYSFIAAQPVIPGLVAYWNMNSNFNDASGNGINGINFGATPAANNLGIANSSMQFNKTNTFPDVENYATHPLNSLLNFSGNQNFSISALININTTYGRPGGIYDNHVNYGGYGVWYWKQASGYELRFNYRNGSLGMLDLPTESWVHVTAIRENGILKLYLNGVLKSNGPEGNMIPSYFFPARIGTMFYEAFSTAEYNGHNGRIDELRVFDRALTSAEVLELNSSLLPLKMGRFIAVQRPLGIELNWETLSEANTGSFVIERSYDGKNFISIGSVPAAGTSSRLRQYSFLCKEEWSKLLFFRIRMIDVDGTSTLSRVVIVNNASKTDHISLYPNPVVNNIQFQLTGTKGEKVIVEIYDVQGRKYYASNHELFEGIQTISLPTISLSSGQFYLKVVRNGEVRVLKFLKN